MDDQARPVPDPTPLEERKFAAEEEHRRQERVREDRKLGLWRLLLSSALPLAGPSVAALIAFLAGIHSERTNTATALKVESLRDQAQLILQALSGRDQPQAVVALKFLASAGMIPDYQEEVLALATSNKGAAVPSSSPPTTILAPPTAPNGFAIDFVIGSGKTGMMKIPAGTTCAQIRPLSYIFQPKLGLPLGCLAVLRAEDSYPPFDEKQFEKDNPGVVIR